MTLHGVHQGNSKELREELIETELKQIDPEDSDDGVLYGDDTLPCGDDTLPCGDDTLPCGDDTLPCGDDKLPCGDDTLPCGDDTLPCGDELATETPLVDQSKSVDMTEIACHPNHSKPAAQTGETVKNAIAATTQQPESESQHNTDHGLLAELSFFTAAGDVDCDLLDFLLADTDPCLNTTANNSLSGVETFFSTEELDVAVAAPGDPRLPASSTASVESMLPASQVCLLQY